MAHPLRRHPSRTVRCFPSPSGARPRARPLPRTRSRRRGAPASPRPPASTGKLPLLFRNRCAPRPGGARLLRRRRTPYRGDARGTGPRISDPLSARHSPTKDRRRRDCGPQPRARRARGQHQGRTLRVAISKIAPDFSSPDGFH
ncbi:unnamed protein product, partial [Ascophyllum nodosum]